MRHLYVISLCCLTVFGVKKTIPHTFLFYITFLSLKWNFFKVRKRQYNKKNTHFQILQILLSAIWERNLQGLHRTRHYWCKLYFCQCLTGTDSKFTNTVWHLRWGKIDLFLKLSVSRTPWIENFVSLCDCIGERVLCFQSLSRIFLLVQMSSLKKKVNV